MLLITFSIACLVWLLVPVTTKLADRKPFNCHKCMAFWLAVVVFGLLSLQNMVSLWYIPLAPIMAEALRNIMNRIRTI